METRIEQWGDTLAVRIPPELAAQLGFSCGDAVNLQSCGYGLTVVPAAAPPAELPQHPLPDIHPQAADARQPYRMVPHHAGFAPGVDPENPKRILDELDIEDYLAKQERTQ